MTKSEMRKLLNSGRHLTAESIAAVAVVLLLSACGGGSDDGDVAEAACFDDALYAAGATASITYRESGLAVGERSENSQVISTSSTFNGTDGLLERRLTIAGEAVSNGTRQTTTGDVRNFERPHAGGVPLRFGSIAVSGPASTQRVERTITYSPPYQDGRNSLAAGETRQFVMAGRDDTKTLLSNTSVDFSQNVQITFVGKETLSVPAGRYSACRYDVRVGDGPTTKEWVYRGLSIRREESNGPTVLEMTSGTLNGQPL